MKLPLRIGRKRALYRSLDEADARLARGERMSLDELEREVFADRPKSRRSLCENAHKEPRR